MKFILFVEGQTEQKSVPEFLRRWLDTHLTTRVGIQSVKFEGYKELIADSPKKADMYLGRDDVIAVIAILDLYGPQIYPKDKNTVAERVSWAKPYLEKCVNKHGFYQFFAVHEIEAWLLSDPSIFPNEIRNAFTKKTKNPETVNFNEHPAKLLNNIYRSKTKHDYKKVVQGQQFFKKLDPNIAYDKCPYLKLLLDDMLVMAKARGC
jgi:hypothetical protein